ncbi:hypothetical protein ACDI16_22255, partial [Oceanobacillus caeni]
CSVFKEQSSCAEFLAATLLLYHNYLFNVNKFLLIVVNYVATGIHYMISKKESQQVFDFH